MGNVFDAFKSISTQNDYKFISELVARESDTVEDEDFDEEALRRK